MPLVSLNPNNTTPHITETMSTPPPLPPHFDSFPLFSGILSDAQFRYWQPQLGENESFIDPFADSQSGLKPVHMQARKITFRTRLIGIPAHCHWLKEKTYTVIMGDGMVCVFVKRPDESTVERFILHAPGQALAIPPKHWHAVLCTGSDGNCTLLVHMVQTPTLGVVPLPDIAWEPGKDRLLLEQPGMKNPRD